SCSKAARRAATCWSSARTASSRASKSSWWGRARGRSGRGTSRSRRTSAPRTWPARTSPSKGRSRRARGSGWPTSRETYRARPGRARRGGSGRAAVVEAEGIEVGDEELLDSLRSATQGPGRGGGPGTSERKLQKALDRAKAEGRDEALREDIAMRKAVDLMV